MFKYKYNYMTRPSLSWSYIILVCCDVWQLYLLSTSSCVIFGHKLLCLLFLLFNGMLRSLVQCVLSITWYAQHSNAVCTFYHLVCSALLYSVYFLSRDMLSSLVQCVLSITWYAQHSNAVCTFYLVICSALLFSVYFYFPS